MDLSKLLMYDFNYKYIGVEYGSGAQFLFKDTDSLVYELRQTMFMKIFMRTGVCLILVTIL